MEPAGLSCHLLELVAGSGFSLYLGPEHGQSNRLACAHPGMCCKHASMAVLALWVLAPAVVKAAADLLSLGWWSGLLRKGGWDV